VDQAISQAPSRPIELRHASTDRPNVVVVPERRFLAIEGVGHPGASGFRVATAALREAHQTIRVALRRDHFLDGPRSILEIVLLTDAAWPLEELLRVLAERDAVRWRQMLELPPAATPDLIARGVEAATMRHESPPPRPMTTIEGRAAQLLQIGPSTDLSSTVARLHGFITDAGWRPQGSIHQLIYADAEAVPSSRARSIVRMPIA
jgi:hypothetical protein